MKKVFVFLFLIASMFSLFGATDPFKVQTISGFIDDICYLYVSPFTFDYVGTVGYTGINLDPNDNTSTYGNLVNPPSSALSSSLSEDQVLPRLGVQMGTFSVLATYTQSTTVHGVKLTITHSKLVHTTDSSAKLEYELGVLYAISNGTTTGSNIPKICLSTEASSNNKIEIELAQESKIVAIQNAYLYFRLAYGETATVTGQYESIVTFSLEAI